ncbi:MAG: aminobenzoyl-glutamate utilization protein B, partial [Arcticibacterium sp.]
AAAGAALGTGTTMDYEIIGGTHELLPNLNLQKMVHEKLTEVGGITYNKEELAFANEIAKSLGQEKADLLIASGIAPYKTEAKAGGSTDVGDVSFAVPTVGFGTATWVPGTAAHSWQAVAAGGTSIGKKGMMVAAKTLSLSAIELFSNPKIIKAAKEEHQKRLGTQFKYIPLIGNRAPALDYRN